MNEQDRPVVAAINKKLIDELKIRKDTIESETGRKAKGGITCFSELAALELMSIRQTGDKIFKEILKIKNIPVKKFTENGIEKEFVPYELFKKLLLLSSTLSRKKDQVTLKVEMIKIRGLKKNEVRYFW